MRARYAIVPEMTVECEFRLYNGGVDCGSGGKYALLDLDDPTGGSDPQKFFCMAHFCSEHALAGLKMANEKSAKYLK